MRYPPKWSLIFAGGKYRLFGDLGKLSVFDDDHPVAEAWQEFVVLPGKDNGRAQHFSRDDRCGGPAGNAGCGYSSTECGSTNAVPFGGVAPTRKRQPN